MIINGWSLFGYPYFIEQYQTLAKKVAQLKKLNPTSYKKKNDTKRLAAIHKLVFEVIPDNPMLPDYRQGSILGGENKHWFRAKFFQQYRLFFRFHTKSKVIVFAWVNDENNKRAYNKKSDAYQTFKRMLDNGKPPSSWEELIDKSKALSADLIYL